VQLDRLSVVIRPRNAWESVDLGFILVQRWWLDLYKVWFAIILPLFVLIYCTTYLLGISKYATFIIWWLKPLYDRIVLHFLSHAVFDEHPTIKQTYKALPSLIFNSRLFLNLTFLRLDLARSFHLPIWQLEKPSFMASFKRSRVMQKGTANIATWLTVVCVHFEWVLTIALFGLIYLLIPVNVEIEWHYFFFAEEETGWFGILTAMIEFIVLGIIEPFYVAAGFSLYLNRRTHLEGWDIELSFRRIAKRLTELKNSILPFIIIGIFTLSFLPTLTQAQTASPEMAKTYIEEVLQQPEFGETKEVYEWRYIDDKEINNQQIPDFNMNADFRKFLSLVFANFFEIILWLIVIGVTIYLIIYLSKKPWTQPFFETQQHTTYQFSQHILKQQVDEKMLPDNIAQDAWQLWQDDKKRAAISLLYRGSLYTLQTHKGLNIHESATEKECVNLVKRTQSEEIGHYFVKLTHSWQAIAYAKQLPDEITVKELCHHWETLFLGKEN